MEQEVMQRPLMGAGDLEGGEDMAEEGMEEDTGAEAMAEVLLLQVVVEAIPGALPRHPVAEMVIGTAPAARIITLPSGQNATSARPRVLGDRAEHQVHLLVARALSAPAIG